MGKKVLFCWSGGKDSSLALHRLMQDNSYEVVGLLTTINKTHKRVSMHGITEDLVEMQAASIGLPLHKVYISEGTNEEYEQNMQQELEMHAKQGVTHVGFGDIFLEDLKKYRENQCKLVELETVFPLWKEKTSFVINEFLREGFQTMMCCVSEKVGEEFAGKVITEAVIKSLPNGIDVCGENGEFHTFAFAGPIFKNKINIKNKEVIRKEYSWTNEDGKEEKSTFFFADIVSD